MKYIDEYRDKELVLSLSKQIKKLSKKKIKLMEVCGGHTMSIQKFGLPYLLPDTEYRLTLQYRYAGKGTLLANLVCFNEVNRVVAEKRVALPPEWPFTWREAALELTTPPGTHKAFVRLINQDRSGKGLTGWVDHLRLIEKSPADN